MKKYSFITQDNTSVQIISGTGTNSPGVVFLGGLGASHDLFEKGQYLLQKCEEKGIAFSSINWQTPENGLVSTWRQNLKEAFNHVSQEMPQTIVASSFGAWLGGLLTRDLAGEGKESLIQKLVLINPVFDGTRIAAHALGEQGRNYLAASADHAIPFQLPSMQKPFLLKQEHLTDGEKSLILNSKETPLPSIKTHIFHANGDPVAPIALSEGLISRLDPSLAVLEKISGGHECNSKEFLEKLWGAVYVAPTAPAKQHKVSQCHKKKF